MALFQIDETQFDQLETHLNGLNGAVNKLAEGVAPVDSSIHAAIVTLSDNLGKWQAAQLQAIKDGFVLIADVLSNHQTSVSQEEIDAATNRLKTSTDQLGAAVDAAATNNPLSNS